MPCSVLERLGREAPLLFCLETEKHNAPAEARQAATADGKLHPSQRKAPCPFP